MSKNVSLDKLINQCELIRDTLNSGCVECDLKAKKFYDDMIDALSQLKANDHHIDTLSYLKANEHHLKPKQVEYTEYDGYADGCPVYETGICPNCNREFEVESEEHYNYCPACGQKLKW